MIPIDAPKHKVIAYQKQQDVYYVNGREIRRNDDDLLIVNKKSFPIGSLFYYTVQTAASVAIMTKYKKATANVPDKTPSNNDGRARGGSEDYDEDDEDDYDDDDEDGEKARNPLTIEVPPMTKLCIDTVTIEPPKNHARPSSSSSMSIYVSTESNEFACLCPSISHGKASMIQNLNIAVVGPTTLQFALIHNQDPTKITHSKTKIGHVNLFGRVDLVEEEIANAIVDARTTHVFDELQEMNDAESILDAANSDISLDGSVHNSNQYHRNSATSTTSYMRPSKISFQSLKDIESKTTHNEAEDMEKENDNDHYSKEDECHNDDMDVDDSNDNDKALPKSGDEGATTDTIHKKKRKLDNENESTNNNLDPSKASTSIPESTSATPKIQKLSKKQRKKLAKQKAKELEEAVAKEQGFSSSTSATTDGGKGQNLDLLTADGNAKSKKVSLTKERALSCGVLVRDIVHGTGSEVRLGRKVSINYVGTLANNNKEFDKNNSKTSPLMFRIGTGEVIKGLDKGMEGMKVGGERSITIPPELGYGRKRSGKIPPNSTLCFEVKLLSVGGGKK